MGTTLGIYEPFKPYVKKQLEVRKNLMENSDSLRNEEFYAYTVEKRCVITMASGVDLRESAKDDFLEEDEKEKKIGSGLARQYILQGGTQHYNREGGYAGLREGFTTLSEKDDRERSFSYGDKNIRSNPDGDFGIVPMPGIVDATIATKSAEGALREATVNFVCHNRRQLSVLETLYMRIGFPLLLEWQWSPYIDNDGNKQTAEATVLDEFFNPDSDFDKLNAKIKQYKEASGGNYDGFVGYCKNFSFKAREDGGYDYQTEIMAQGDLIERLKIGKEILQYDIKTTDNRALTKIEIMDQLLLYLRSIKKTAYFTENEPDVRVIGEASDSRDSYRKGGGNKVLKDKRLREKYLKFYDDLFANGQISQTAYDQVISDYNFNSSITYTVTDQKGLIKRTYSGEYRQTSIYNVGSKENPYYILYENLKNYQSNKLYLEAYSKIEALYLDIIKGNKLPESEELNDEVIGRGYKTFLGGTILKQVIKYNDVDTSDFEQNSGENIYNRRGYDNNIYVRWDLLCQIINQLCTDQYKEGKPVMELSYMNDGALTYALGEKRKTINTRGEIFDNVNLKTDGSVPLEKVIEKHFYVPYSTPDELEIADPVNLISNQTNRSAQDTYDEVIDPMVVDSLSSQTNESDGKNKGKRHPLLGHSYDYEVCLLPHMKFFDNLNVFDPDIFDGQDNEGMFATQNQSSYLPLTSYNNIFYYPDNPKNNIGYIYFNLDYLIREYVNMRFVSTKNESIEDTTTPRLNQDFGLYDFVKQIWDGVNDACAGYYNFDITTEHERPHIVKVIEKTFNNKIDNPEDLFEFDPQSLNSITRDFVFDSSITKDFASAVSIAAQAPKEENSLEVMTFKAFNKNVKNRFTSSEIDLEYKNQVDQDAKFNMQQDVNRYVNLCYAVSEYIKRLANADISPYFDEDGTYRNVLTANEAKLYVQELEELRISILQRHPLLDKDGNENPLGKVGHYRNTTSIKRNMVIPLNFTVKMDGIGGILPRQVFKINPQRLPKAYENSKISFIVFPESQTINSAGDWTVEFTGQMVHDNSETDYNIYMDREGEGINNDGTNPYDGNFIPKRKGEKLDNIDKAIEGLPGPENIIDSSIWANPVDHPIVINSPWGRERPDGDPNRRHTGVDIRASVQGIAGDLVGSAAAGTVISTKESLSGCGNEVTIKHIINGEEFRTRYCHLDIITVQIGDVVEMQQRIGIMGDSGDAEGVHLHYEVYDLNSSIPSWWQTLSNGKVTSNVLTSTTDPCKFLHDTQQEGNIFV